MNRILWLWHLIVFCIFMPLTTTLLYTSVLFVVMGQFLMSFEWRYTEACGALNLPPIYECLSVFCDGFKEVWNEKK